MIEVSDIVADADMTAPKPFTILRSTGLFVQGGFQSTTVSIETSGPVQPATDKEVAMLPEADRVGGVMSFWSLQPIYTTRGKTPLPAVQNAALTGAFPGTVYTLNPVPPTGVVGNLTLNGLLLIPGVDYTLANGVITLTQSTSATDTLFFSWPITSAVGQAASDILVYGDEQYRVLASRQYPGSGYWKAMGTRLSAV